MDTTLVPFRQFVLKMHSRCDLACDHCYIYEHADTSWRGRPKVTADDVLAQTALRIAEHAGEHQLDTAHVVLHGGEPLLAGVDRLRRAAEALRGALAGVCALDLRIHTNGVQLDQQFCDLFLEYDIKVGISLDGDRAANDLHRRYADGRSSYAKVLKAVALLNEPPYRRLYAGLLCTIDVRNDPIAVYDALIALDPPRIDFLLPHATWDQPPLRPDGASAPYAAWLGAIFARWEEQGRPVPVRFFDSILRTLRGQSSLTESLGLAPADLVVIETDGSLEQADSLKTAFDGAPATGFDVFNDDLTTAARHPGMIDRQHGLAGLCAQCRSCPVVESCGGGLYAHRYRSDNGFDNPSVFCPDLLELITDIQERTVRAQSEAVPEPAPLADDQLQELAAGYGGTGTVRALAANQLSLSRELVATVFERAGQGGGVRSAWELITELDVEAPEALDPVLAHPYTRAWALRCLQPEGSGPAADAGSLSEIAAAAAVRAGHDRGVLVPVRDGRLRLPTLGAVLLDGASEALVTAEPGGFTVRLGSSSSSGSGSGSAGGAGEVLRIRQDDEADPRWQPVRHCELPGWRVALEDTDPQRDAHLHPVAGRLSSAEAAAWRAGLAEAWQLLGRTLPGYTEGVAAGLSTITPLAPAPAGRSVSAAARQAFGAVGIARPPASDLLALLIIHEFQHVKLGAVLDLYDLFDPADTKPRFFPPWRPDPRPLEGLLQGTYAHVAVAEYWRSRRLDLIAQGAASEQVEQAAEQFDTWRWHTAKAVEDVAGSGSLTPAGERFAAGMRATVAPWLDEPGTTTA